MFLLLFGSGIIYFLLTVASLRCILTGYTMLPGETQVLSHTLAHLFLERPHPCGNGAILVSGFSGCLRFRLFSKSLLLIHENLLLLGVLEVLDSC